MIHISSIAERETGERFGYLLATSLPMASTYERSRVRGQT